MNARRPSPGEHARFVLVPNVGAEEGADWPRFAKLAAVRSTVAAWRLLFPAEQVLLGQADAAPRHWPAALGPEPAGAAFAWIDAQPGAWAWLADTSAHALAEMHDARWTGPAPALVERIHDKAFAARVVEEADLAPPSLRGTTASLDEAQLASPDAALAALDAALARWPAGLNEWVIKPRRGSSGRGHLRGRRSAHARDARDALRRALPRFAARGGALVEPWLERTCDLSVSFHVPSGGEDGASEVELLGSLEQLVTRAGVPLGHVGEIDEQGRIASGSRHDDALRAAALVLARAAACAGYTGPGGLDAFAFRLPSSDPDVHDEVLRPVVELNARFTVGVVAIGVVRRLLAAGASGRGPLLPGRRAAFLFRLRPPPGFATWTAAAAAASPRASGIALGDEAVGPGLVIAPERRALAPLFIRSTAPDVDPNAR